jgi:hypothetical protein
MYLPSYGESSNEPRSFWDFSRRPVATTLLSVPEKVRFKHMFIYVIVHEVRFNELRTAQ